MSDLFAFLASAEAFALRDELRGTDAAADPLRLAAALRKRLAPAQARALAEQILLEGRAGAKLPEAARLLFERVPLEQATSPACAARHAACVPAGAAVVDAGCGLGADSYAFARAGCRVIALERDPFRAKLARHNLGVLAGESSRSLVARGEAARLPARGDALFLDPDRRASGRRQASLATSSPSWSEIAALLPRFARALVKAPPALADDEIPPECAVEFLSEGGECKEALLRFGAGETPGRRAAVLAATGETRVVEDGPPAGDAANGAFLLDPDPALRRAGGVDALARELGAARVSPESTYLFADVDPRSTWARAYPVLHVFPYRPSDLARRLASDPPREILVKQRGLRLPEADVRRGLPREVDGPIRVVVLFPRGRARVACLCAPPDPR
ncbi:MAG: hypothetical protein U0167_02140 [bacterium]